MSNEQLSLYGLDDVEVFVETSETDEAYTTDSDKYPLIRTVTSFYGQIGLDPTSNPEKSIPARHHFTKEDDCLSRSWNGLGPVFMNPPYSTCHPFLDKALQEFHKGHVPEVIFLILCTTATSKRVGPLLRSGCSALCFVHGRPPYRFGYGARRDTFGTLTVPNVMFYAGSRSSEFCEHFTRLGTTAYTHPLDHVLRKN